MPSLFVLSGPSGAGKDAVLQGMKDSGLAFYHTITMTTRPQRAGERDGVDYHFISEEKFFNMIERDDLLEWAEVYGHRYGVPRQPVEQAQTPQFGEPLLQDPMAIDTEVTQVDTDTTGEEQLEEGTSTDQEGTEKTEDTEEE